MGLYLGGSKCKVSSGNLVFNFKFYIKANHRVMIMPEQTFTFVQGAGGVPSILSMYIHQEEDELVSTIYGKKYIVIFDGVEYECISDMADGNIGIGNPYFFTGNTSDDNGVPFIIYYQPSIDTWGIVIHSDGSSTETHTIAVYEEPQLITRFAYNSTYGAYAVDKSIMFPLSTGETYTVIWDDVEYECTAQYLSAVNVICVGDCSAFGGSGNGEPFIIACDEACNGNTFFSTDTKESHTVLVYKKEDNANDDRSTLLEQTTIDGFFFEGDMTDISFYIEQRDLSNVIYGNIYTVSWNGNEYNCRCYNDGYGSKVLGNSSFDYGQDTGEPFVICYYPDSGEVLYASYEARTSNTVAIYGDSEGIVL